MQRLIAKINYCALTLIKIWIFWVGGEGGLQEQISSSEEYTKCPLSTLSITQTRISNKYAIMKLASISRRIKVSVTVDSNWENLLQWKPYHFKHLHNAMSKIPANKMEYYSLVATLLKI